MDSDLDDARFDLYVPQIGAARVKFFARVIIAALVVMAVQIFSISLQSTEAAFAEQDIASLLEKVNKLKESGRYQEAIPLLQQTIAYLENSLGPNDKFVGAELDSLADLRSGPGYLNRISASIGGASAGVKLPSGRAAA
jgi:hypothetical protein